MKGLLVATTLFACQALVASVTKVSQPVDAVDLLKHEVRTLNGEKERLQDDKQALLNTVQQVLKGNTTREDVLRRQIAELTQAKASEERDFARERASLQAQVHKAEETDAAGKEVLQSLQDQNVDLKAQVEKLGEELAANHKTIDVLTYDKQHLMQAMHKLLRANVEHAEKEAPAAVASAVVAKKDTTNVTEAHHNGTVGNLRKKHKAAKPQAPSLEKDPTAYMAETSAMNSYIARSTAEEEFGVTATQAPVAAPEEGASVNFVKWLNGQGSSGSERAHRMTAAGASPLDAINPQAKPVQAHKEQPSEPDEADVVEGVDTLLKQAQDELGPVDESLAHDTDNA